MSRASERRDVGFAAAAAAAVNPFIAGQQQWQPGGDDDRLVLGGVLGNRCDTGPVVLW